jgi:hypothetical protein
MATLTKDKLTGAGSSGRLIKECIEEHIRVINRAMKDHDLTWGWNTVTVPLQTNFNIHGLKPAKSQLIVYTQLISSLTSRTTHKGDPYDVRITLPTDGDPHANLYIGWSNELTEDDFESLRVQLRKHFIADIDIKPWLDGKMRPVKVPKIADETCDDDPVKEGEKKVLLTVNPGGTS